MKRRTELHTNDNADKAVSPVIAIILMVAITVVLAGVLYVWVTSFQTPPPSGVTIGGTFRTQNTGLNQNYTFEFTAPSGPISIEAVAVALVANEVQLAQVKLVDLPSSGTSQVIYKDWSNDIADGNITFYDNNGNGNLDSGDKINLDPDSGRDWTSYNLLIQVDDKQAMDRELTS